MNSTQRKKIRILVNPKAGGGNLQNRLKMLETMFPDIVDEIVISKSAKDLQQKAIEAAREKRQLYISGGDGALVLVLNALCAKNLSTPLLFLGTGSSNDIANHLGIQTQKQILESLKKKPELLDIGHIQGHEHSTYFMGQANIGLGAYVNNYVERKKKKYSWAYGLQNFLGAIAIIKNFTSKKNSVYASIKILVDKNFTFDKDLPKAFSKKITVKKVDKKSIWLEGYFDVILTANIKYWAGGMTFVPQANAKDSRLNLLLIQSGSLWNMLKIIIQAGKGKMRPYIFGKNAGMNTDKNTNGVVLIPFQQADISFSKSEMIQVDGEVPLDKENIPMRFQKLKVKVIPQAQSFFCNKV